MKTTGIGNLAEEVIHERRDVVGALAQRRRADMDDPEPVEEVFAELSLPHALSEVAVRRRDDADIGVGTEIVGADGLNFAALEKSQQERLHPQAHVADFVEKERAPIRQLELARLVAVGAGEAAADMAEQLRFEQTFGQAGAVQRDKRTFGALRQVVNLTGDEILADPALAGDEYLGVALGGTGGTEKQRPHGLALAHHGPRASAVT